LGHPRIFKFFSKSKGIVIVSGYENTKLLLNKEFDTVVSQVVPFTSKLVGENSLRCSRDKQEHTMLRKLIGMALAPPKVNVIIPALQETSQQLIDEGLASTSSSGTTINVEELCQCYTLHVACRLLIGPEDLPNHELAHFRNQVQTWIGGLYATNEDWKDARAYLVNKIESKLDSLEKNGPDASSTVSGMWFATDPDDSTQQRLTRDAVIDNTLLLILAGSETSASTLTNCMFLFGLHINAWTTVVEEQVLCVQKHGNDLNRKVLDNDCMYLDAVVRESLRLRPIVGGSMRGTTSTIVVDGCQIPANWGVTYDRYLTHLLDPTTQNENGDNMDVRNGFRPERWLDEATRPGGEFIPFGVGPRYCIGADLAMVEMKVFFATFARSLPDFDLVTPNPKKGDIRWRQKSIIPIPEEGVFIRPRQHETRITH
jgi:cytochrome P450